MGQGEDVMPEVGMQPTRHRQITSATIGTIYALDIAHGSIRPIGWNSASMVWWP